jgi:predicted alpha/beta superfamily hydrolase/TolA-binding protein
MKLFYCSILYLLFSFHVHAQENNRFTIGYSEKISSKILGEDREILIHIPNSNGGSKIKDRGHYPVIYLLDGEENFNSVVSITEHMEETSLCPPMIVVGIVHTNRLSDLTTGFDKEYMGAVSNGKKFMSFVEKELIPHIDSTYPTTTYKTFIGHSVGGLTVMNTLLNKPNLFNSYVSLDGALWWNEAKVVKEAKTMLATKNYKGKTLYIAMANRLERGVDTLSVQNDTTGNTSLIRSNLSFIKELQKANKNQLRYRYKFYEDDNHPSIRLIGEYDALRYIFDFYRLRIYDSEMSDPKFNLDILLVSHYNNVSKQMGYIVKPNESQVNSLGYQMIATKQFKKAESLFKLNISNNPNSGNCYDSIGDLYLAMGNKTKAIASFKKALTLAEIPDSKAKLEKLLNEKN